MTTPMTKEALREEFQYMQGHYSDPADRERQVIYIAAEALLDELEAKDAALKASGRRESAARMRVDELLAEGEAHDTRITDLEESHRQVIEARDLYKRLHEEGLKSLQSRAESAEQDLLLERQKGDSVREDGNQFLVVRHPGKAPVIKHWTGSLEERLREIMRDPMVTIDIVTHRYYGVGGQWVQDADEYLQAAGATLQGGE